MKNNITDTPGGRKIHKASTPSMGGIPIFIGVAFTVLLWFSLKDLNASRSLLSAVTIMFFIGLRDDLVNLSALQKLMGQLAAAVLIVGFADIRFTSMYGLLGIYEIPDFIAYPLSVFTIIVITNAFNLIDGIDGLAGSISMIALSFFGVWFGLNGMTLYTAICAAFVGAIGGFLIFNWSPAKIFMGDTGALSIGILLASLAVLFIDTNYYLPEGHALKFNGTIATAVAVLILPLYDTARIFVKRIRRGKSPMSPDKSHVHHFVMRMGFNHPKTTSILIISNLIFIGAAVLGRRYGDLIMLPVIMIGAAYLGVVLDKMVLVRVKRLTKNAPRVLEKYEHLRESQIKPKIEKDIIYREKISSN
ncbi:MraY family glycosyltransferase [Penaeicola halotolerans]|uniref:MraY family glycosyltransferase n=1 Tax=Penaeicola halotolerans TaxID=2793196 RepID=UPI001CF83E29|nr:MraY family glycosyltransferase [Penaeicola halotolerans]